MSRIRVIAIDGPAAAGKTTLALELAKRLGYLYFDTGLMYRAVTLAVLNLKVSLNDEKAVAEVANEVRIDVLPASANDGRPCTVELDGTDVTWQLREPRIDKNVSIPSAYAAVRAAMTQQQRRIAARGSIVMVGRDIGTVVLPDADLKIFLKASVEARARRRWLEFEASGNSHSFEEVLEDMRNRDQRDQQRDVAPLKPAEDAYVIDCTDLDINAVLELVYSRILQLESGEAK